MKFSYDTIPLSVTLEDGSQVIHYFMVTGRGSLLPPGAYWSGAHQWKRDPVDAVIVENLNASFQDRPYVSWRKLSEGDIPQDRTFRNAWVDDGKAIVHDMDKAKQLKREHLRHERAGVFPVLDAQWSRAFGQGKADEAAAVERRRQVLRDLPADPRIEAATTVDDLHAIKLPE